jgi:peptidoglycan/LPS O-acetylase OafA/YrhL
MLTPIDSPTQVRNAFLLLSASFALTAVDSGIALFVSGFSEDDPGYLLWWLIAFSFALLAANAYGIYYASRRRNWARFVLLALLLVSVALTVVMRFVWPAEWGDEDFWSSATTGAYFVMDAIALYWLFTRAGAR